MSANIKCTCGQSIGHCASFGCVINTLKKTKTAPHNYDLECLFGGY